MSKKGNDEKYIKFWGETLGKDNNSHSVFLPRLLYPIKCPPECEEVSGFKSKYYEYCARYVSLFPGIRD